MDVIVSCPACRLSVSVPEDDVLTAEIRCPRCRHVFGPLGPDAPPPPPPPSYPPSYPKIPAYTAPAKVARPPRARGPRPRARPVPPAGADGEPAATPVGPRHVRLWPWAAGAAAVVLFGLVAAGGVGWWAVKRASGEGRWARHSPPDAPEAGLEFPATPAVAAEPIAIVNPATGEVTGHDSLWMFKCDLPNGETYAVRAEDLPWEQVRAIPAERLRRGHLTNVPMLVRGGDPRQFQYRSPPTAGYPSDECFIPPVGGRGYVFRMLLVDGRLYTLLVSGPGVTPEAPRAVRFFDSFRHARVTPGEAAEPTPDVPDPDALRLIAQVPSHNAAIIAPRLNAVFLSVGWGAVGHPLTYPTTPAPVRQPRIVPDGVGVAASSSYLVRCHYPSFRVEAAGPVAASFTAVAVDATGAWVRGWGPGPQKGGWRERAGDVTYPAPDPRIDWASREAWARPPEPTRYDPAGATFASGGRSPSADRARLYSMAGTSPAFDYSSGREYDGGLVRAFDYPGLTLRGERTVPGARGGVAVPPDAARVYVVTGPAENRPVARAVVEIDADTLRVVREAPIRSNVAHIAAIGGGRVLGFGWGTRRGNTARRYALAALIDLNADPPRELLIDLRGHPDRHLLHGDRLYTLGNGELHLFNVSGAAACRIRLLGAVCTGGATEMALSPDGKYLIVNTGCVYWTGGAGPLPPVDPGARL